jgi:hypothetical protein
VAVGLDRDGERDGAVQGRVETTGAASDREGSMQDEEVTRLGDGGCCCLAKRSGRRTSTNARRTTPGLPRHTEYVKHATPVNSSGPLPDWFVLVLNSFREGRCTMDPPNLGALNLSDSDTDGDALFDTPAAHKAKKTKDVESDAEGAASTRPRAKESHYTAEEAREAALRRELESIRNVNKVIEGVIGSLQKAKDNMAVRV